MSFAPNATFWRTARTISSGVSAYRYSGNAMSARSGGRSWYWPPKGPMIRPALTNVGPGTRPFSIARRSAVSA